MQAFDSLSVCCKKHSYERMALHAHFITSQVFRLDKHKSIADAVTAITDALGMDACEGSATVSGAGVNLKPPLREMPLLCSGNVISTVKFVILRGNGLQLRSRSFQHVCHA